MTFSNVFCINKPVLNNYYCEEKLKRSVNNKNYKADSVKNSIFQNNSCAKKMKIKPKPLVNENAKEKTQVLSKNRFPLERRHNYQSLNESTKTKNSEQLECLALEKNFLKFNTKKIELKKFTQQKITEATTIDEVEVVIVTNIIGEKEVWIKNVDFLERIKVQLNLEESSICSLNADAWGKLKEEITQHHPNLFGSRDEPFYSDNRKNLIFERLKSGTKIEVRAKLLPLKFSDPMIEEASQPLEFPSRAIIRHLSTLFFHNAIELPDDRRLCVLLLREYLKWALKAYLVLKDALSKENCLREVSLVSLKEKIACWAESIPPIILKVTTDPQLFRGDLRQMTLNILAIHFYHTTEKINGSVGESSTIQV
ncbi:hypothetical protein PHSC3_000075 [Chlamydiales bacterium STE3]|nr:hypothetical protein PHSC3_000075 [Chlamydiales bacterium STE3]